MAGSWIAMLKRMAMQRIGVADDGPDSQGVPQGSPNLDNAIHVSPIRIVTEEELGVPGDDLDHWKRRPGDEGTSTRKAPQKAPPVQQKEDKKQKSVQVDDPKPSKKRKSSSKKVELVQVDAGFLKKNLEEYRVDPVGAAAKLFVHQAGINKLQKDEMQRRQEELVNAEKAKLFNTLKTLEEKNKLLNQSVTELSTLKSEKDLLEIAKNSAKRQAEDSAARVKELEGRIKELEVEKKEAEEKIQELEGRISELTASLQKAKENKTETSATPEARYAALEKELAKARADLAESQE